MCQRDRNDVIDITALLMITSTGNANETSDVRGDMERIIDRAFPMSSRR